MKFELEEKDIQALANEVMKLLHPYIRSSTEKDEILTVEEAATFLKVSVKWIYERTRYNEIPFKRIGGLIRFKKSDLMNL